ncbi:putative reverse transcriptase domain-containing protein [Tanacetum coccineum]
MPPKRTSAAARVAAATATAATAAAAPITAIAVEQLIEARVSTVLANHEILQNITNGHGNSSHNSDTRIRGTVRTSRECTYKDFLNCKPLTFKENQVKFATCTFLGNALTWWNSHMKAVTQDVAYALDWKTLKKMMTAILCVFQEIALILEGCANEESDKKLRNWGTNNKTRDRTLGGLTLLGLVKRGSTRDHCPCVQNATITTKGHVLPGVISIKRSAIWLVTVGVLVSMGHFKKECPKLKNGNGGNQRGNGNALAKVYVVGNAGTNLDSNVVTDHPFNINLMRIELGSFDVIIGMDWLSKYHTLIDCAKKSVRIPWGNEILIVHGDGTHVTMKETEEKMGEK